jgi:hypothetical protein
MVDCTSDDRELTCQNSSSPEVSMTRILSTDPRTGSPRSLRFLLTLALVPAAGVTLVGAGLASASDAPRTPVARTTVSAGHPEPGDDRGSDVRTIRPTPHPTDHASTAPRTREAGDDSGGRSGQDDHGDHGAATATAMASTSRPVTARAIEPGDDSAGGHRSQPQSRTHVRSGDDAVRGSSSPIRASTSRASEVGDDRGDDGGRAARAPEAGDDSGGHGGRGTSSAGSGSSGRHGGSDDGPGHS